MAFHHVAPGEHIASTRTPKLEFGLVDDDVLPHTILVDYSATPTVPLAWNHLWLINGVFPNMHHPMPHVDIVDMQPFRAISPQALDHLQGFAGAWSSGDVPGTPRLRGLRLRFHSTALTNPFPLFFSESLEGQQRERTFILVPRSWAFSTTTFGPANWTPGGERRRGRARGHRASGRGTVGAGNIIVAVPVKLGVSDVVDEGEWNANLGWPVL